MTLEAVAKIYSVEHLHSCVQTESEKLCNVVNEGMLKMKYLKNKLIEIFDQHETKRRAEKPMEQYHCFAYRLSSSTSSLQDIYEPMKRQGVDISEAKTQIENCLVFVKKKKKALEVMSHPIIIIKQIKPDVYRSIAKHIQDGLERIVYCNQYVAKADKDIYMKQFYNAILDKKTSLYSLFQVYNHYDSNPDEAISVTKFKSLLISSDIQILTDYNFLQDNF